jgi:protein arginine kinase activator
LQTKPGDGFPNPNRRRQDAEGKPLRILLEGEGRHDPTGFALADLLLGLGAAQEIERGGNVTKCPVCGFTQADFKKTGRLGCASCYDTFAEGLSGLIKGMHKGNEHVGKVPTRLQQTIAREQQLKDLQKELRKAVAAENYESAAELRDRIRTLQADR